MIMENDEFKIPKKYCKMSIAQIEQEAEKVLKEIQSVPRNIQRKKKAAQECKDIQFYL